MDETQTALGGDAEEEARGRRPAGASAPAAAAGPQRVPGFAPGRVAARADALACAVILTAMSAVLLATVERKSITVDESVMIPAAYYQVAEGNFRLIHEHPPLSKTLAGLPLLFFDPLKTLTRRDGVTTETAEGRATYLGRFWLDNPAQFRRLGYWARAPMVALAALLGLLVFAFARDLFGGLAAVFAVALYALEPTVLAHARVVQTDIPAAFGCLLVVFSVRRYLKDGTGAGAVFVGAAGGVAVTAKYSMLLVGPAYALLFAALFWRAGRGGASRLAVSKHALAAALALLGVVWAAYFFQSRPLSEGDQSWLAGAFPQNVEAARGAARALSLLFPTDFVLGVLFQISHARDGHWAGLLGRHSAHGWWYYFPVAFALKTTIPFLLLSLASLGWGGWRLWRAGDRRFLFLLVPFALYTLYVMASPINIGVRYYLPAYPFLFIGGGALLARLVARRGAGRGGRAGLAAAALLFCWAGAEAARSFPHYMSYMNQLAAGRPRWWYLSDSNVEWGDDARALSVYLRRRGEKRVGGMFMMAWVTPHYYGVEYVNPLASGGGPRPRPRYTAVGASFLNGSPMPGATIEGRALANEERVNFFAAYRDRTPERVFGNSIYLFREDDGP